jgi:hypothetical protein
LSRAHYVPCRVDPPRRCLRGQAQAALAAAQQESPGEWQDIALALARQIGSDRSAADAALKTLIEKHANGWAYQIAEVYALRGDAKATFDWLDRAWTNRDPGLTNLLFDPFIARYKRDPRFQAMEPVRHLGGYIDEDTDFDVLPTATRVGGASWGRRRCRGRRAAAGIVGCRTAAVPVARTAAAVVMTVPVTVMTTIRLAALAQRLTQVLQEVLQRSCKATARTAARSCRTAGGRGARAAAGALRSAGIDAEGLQQRREVGLQRLQRSLQARGRSVATR